MARTDTCLEPMPQGGFCSACEKMHPKHAPLTVYERDVQMMLIYFRTSTNAQMHTNAAWHPEKLRDLAPAARAELVRSMRTMADMIDTAPEYGGMPEGIKARAAFLRPAILAGDEESVRERIDLMRQQREDMDGAAMEKRDG